MLLRMLAHVHTLDMNDCAVLAWEYKDTALPNDNWRLECKELLSGTTTIKRRSTRANHRRQHTDTLTWDSRVPQREHDD